MPVYRRLEDKIEELETVVTKTETRVTELGAAAGAASASEEEAQRLRDDLEALRRKIKVCQYRNYSICRS